MPRNPTRELAKRQVRRLKAKEKRDRGPRQISDFALLGRWFIGVAAIGLGGLVLAAYFTPMLAITDIKIVGTNRISDEEIAKQLDPVVGESLTQVSEEQVARLLSEFKLIDTVSLESRPPHTLLVRIQEREPIVAVKVNGQYFLYDAAGVKIEPATEDHELPRLINGGSPSTSNKFGTAIAILLEMPQRLFGELESIEVEGDSATIRVKGFDFDVTWGTKAEAALKAEVLDSILSSLDQQPEMIDVSSPLAPVVRY